MSQGPRAIFSECSQPFWLDIGTRLRDERGWNIVYWIAGPELGDDKKQRFPNTIFHGTIDAIKGIPENSCKNLPLLPIDKKILDSLALHQSDALIMMDRLDPGDTLTFDERRELYYYHLGYWGAILKEFKPDVVVFPVMPHVIYNYVLYLLAQHKGITTIMLDWTSIPGLLLPLFNIEKGCEELSKTYNNLLINDNSRPSKISDRTKQYIDNLSKSYQEAIPFYLQHYIHLTNRDKDKTSLKSRLVSTFYPAEWYRKYVKLYNFYFKPAPINYLKEKNKRLSNSSWSGPKWRIYKQKAAQKKKGLQRFYQQLCSTPDLNNPYIFFALHYQPEKTTCPQGGVFTDQLLVARLLSACLPQGWKLYIKEAPGQFMPYLRGESQRNKYYYNSLASLPSTSLIDMEYNSFQLIDNARAVATVTGTAGWEALVRGKPALIFGHAWYRNCEGAFYVPDYYTLQKAIKIVQDEYQVDAKKIEIFLEALENNAVRGMIFPKKEIHADIDLKTNVDNIYNCILTMYEKSIRQHTST